MNEKFEALRAEIELHLAKAHEGTAIHAILSTLKEMLTHPEDEPVVEPVEDDRGI